LFCDRWWDVGGHPRWWWDESLFVHHKLLRVAFAEFEESVINANTTRKWTPKGATCVAKDGAKGGGRWWCN